jgi:hypothetical protein
MNTQRPCKDFDWQMRLCRSRNRYRQRLATSDSDSDSDGVPDCDDEWLQFSNKSVSGPCGGGEAETDSDGASSTHGHRVQKSPLKKIK